MPLPRLSARMAFVLLAAVALGLLAAGLILGELARLQPCHLCNFQRLLYIVFAVLAIGAAALPGWHRLSAGLLALTAGGGVITALQQSWMQYAPQQATECGFGDPTPVERIVDWLGMQWPSMFMVTGFCSDKDWVFLGLSLANWSALCFLFLLACAVWLLFRRTPAG
jgi:disulfide bond formation protein DsbB